jgi:hypothetical protein
MNEGAFANMKTIAGLFHGCTSHKLGRELRAAGYRDDRGDPNRKAIGAGLAIIKRDPENLQWKENLWHVQKVSELLEDFGWKRVATDDTTE